MQSDQIAPAATFAQQAARDGGAILDVRTAAEHEEKRFKGPHDHIPLDQLDPKDFMMRRGLDRDAAVYILCRAGPRAHKAADKFRSAGYTNIHVVEGGIQACESAGVPLEGSGAVSSFVEKSGASCAAAQPGDLSLIERQVRIITAVVIMSAIALGYDLAAIIAAGALLASGVIGQCGLAKFLARLPGSKKSSCAAGAASVPPGKGTGLCS